MGRKGHGGVTHRYLDALDNMTDFLVLDQFLRNQFTSSSQ